MILKVWKLKEKKSGKTKNVVAVILLCVAVVSVAFVIKNIKDKESDFPVADELSKSSVTETESTTAPEKEFVFSPHCTENTSPDNYSLKTYINVGGENVENYQRKDKIDFGFTDKYSDMNGIITFRGNNFRNGAVFGKSSFTEKKLSREYWTSTTTSLGSGSGYAPWSGSGWTGQPLIVKWDDAVKKVMNIKEEKKNKSDLVEVIYATMGGKIYFLDLDDGSYTREPVDLGYTFKGAGALDPRGYPLMYVGAGDSNPGGGAPKFFIVSLIDGKVLFEHNTFDPFADRRWGGCDSSPLVSAETDTLIYPCENGILYTIKLNTEFNEAEGKISVNPNPVEKFKFTTKRSNSSTYWYGMEDSAVVFGSYLYIADNGGNFLCIDLNTMKVIWVQDTLDDTNCTPVLEREGDKVYLYISTSLHWTKVNGRGDIPVWKIDAETGEIVWKTVFNCSTVEGTSGGVQGTIALGTGKYDDRIFVPLAHYPNTYQGGLAALDKESGKQIWYYEGTGYSWTSPSLVFNEKGEGVLVHCDTTGTISLIDPENGKLIDSLKPSGNIEASPAIYNDKIVVGTRTNLILGITLK